MTVHVLSFTAYEILLPTPVQSGFQDFSLSTQVRKWRSSLGLPDALHLTGLSCIFVQILYSYVVVMGFTLKFRAMAVA